MKALQGYLAIFIIRFLALLPLSVARILGRAVGSLSYRLGTDEVRIGRINLKLCYPQQTDAEREQMLQRVCQQSAMTLSEMGLMWARPPAAALAKIRTVHNVEVLEDALAQKRGVLLLAPHLGNWELTSTFIAARSQLTAMYRPARNPVFDHWMHARREKTGATLVPTSVSGVKALYRCLKEGGVVGFLPDQEPQREGGEFAPFMGINALTPRLPHQILQRTGAVALFIFARRLPGGDGFDLHLQRAPEGIYSPDAITALSAMNQGVADCIAHCPQQYQWLYKRFKRQPEGSSGVYRRR